MVRQASNVTLATDPTSENNDRTKMSLLGPIILFARSPQMDIAIYQKSMKTDTDHLGQHVNLII